MNDHDTQTFPNTETTVPSFSRSYQQSVLLKIWLIIALLYAITMRAFATETSENDDLAKLRLDTIESMVGQARMFAGTPDSALLQSIQAHVIQLNGLDSVETKEYLKRSVELVRSTPNPIVRMHLLHEIARVALQRKEYALSHKLLKKHCVLPRRAV